MSDPLNEIKARLLLEELNRRSMWFAILRANCGSSPWSALIPGFLTLFAIVLIWRSFDSDQACAIFILIAALCGIMGATADGVHRRVDALVQLLQQDGMLQSALQPESPPDGAS